MQIAIVWERQVTRRLPVSDSCAALVVWVCARHMYTSDTYINITYYIYGGQMQDVTVNCEFVLGWVLGFGLWRALPLPCRYEVGDEVIEVMVASSNRCSCLMI